MATLVVVGCALAAVIASAVVLAAVLGAGKLIMGTVVAGSGAGGVVLSCAKQTAGTRKSARCAGDKRELDIKITAIQHTLSWRAVQ